MPVYDTIGSGYNTFRAADPYLTDRIVVHLAPTPEGHYLDVGCGTGNYLAALTQRGFRCTGVDPSAKMLAAARGRCPGAAFFQAAAERLPLPDGIFRGAIAILTTHHWRDVGAGLADVFRVLAPGARLVIFTFTPEQVRSYWLREYFPGMIARAATVVPEISALRAMLQWAGFSAVTTEPYMVREDLQDHFLYAHKHRPEQYLRPEVRAAASGFSLLADRGEVARGVDRLAQDMASGRIDQVVAAAEREAGDVGDYLFVIATANSAPVKSVSVSGHE